MDNDLVEIQNIINERNVTQENNILSVDVSKQYEDNKKTLMDKEDFKELTKQITERATKVQLSKDMLAIMSEEQKNAITNYALECQKKQFEYRRKLEKNLICEEVRAEVQNKKIEILKKRYGHLYKKDQNGEIIDFIPSKFHNVTKEIANWWNSTSDNFKKIVYATLKLAFWGVVLWLVVKYGYQILKWIAENFKL